MSPAPVRLGVSGLGRGFMLLLPTLAAHPDVRLTAAADPRADARERFARDFAADTFEDFEMMCRSAKTDAVYIASPHQFHREQVEIAARYRKHVLVEKPMALALADCQAMIDAMAAAGCMLVVGHSHGFDAPYQKTAELIRSGETGRVRMIHALNYTDFLYRPRRPEELDTARGGGVVHSQAAHQVDIVRLLGGGLVADVTAQTGNWNPARNTEGAYSALLRFQGGAFASLTYSGYAHFDSDEFNGWSGELGQRRTPEQYGQARAALARINSPEEEAAFKNRRAYGASLGLADTGFGGIGHNHFGFVLISCDNADLRPTPAGIEIHGDASRRIIPLPGPDIPRREVVDELVRAVRDGIPPVHSGAWGMATTEVCLAILESARTRGTVTLKHQCGPA